jgi:hypothetical protein
MSLLLMNKEGSLMSLNRNFLATIWTAITIIQVI